MSLQEEGIFGREFRGDGCGDGSEKLSSVDFGDVCPAIFLFSCFWPSPLECHLFRKLIVFSSSIFLSTP